MRLLLTLIALAFAISPALAQTDEIELCEHICTMPRTCSANANQYDVSAINMNGWFNFSCTSKDNTKFQWTRRFPDWLARDIVRARPPVGNTELTCQTFCVQSHEHARD